MIIYMTKVFYRLFSKYLLAQKPESYSSTKKAENMVPFLGIILYFSILHIIGTFIHNIIVTSEKFGTIYVLL